MTDIDYRLQRLTIKNYRSLTDFTLDPRESFCEISVASPEAARDIRDFITQLLYSSEAPEGEIVLTSDRDKSVRILGQEGKRRLVGDALAFSLREDEAPGLTLTGLEEEVFRELLCAFVSEGAPEPIAPAVLDHCLHPYGAPKKLMSNIRSLDEKKKIYTTPAGDGKSDRALSRHKELTEQLDAAHALESKKGEYEREIRLYEGKLDENAKRSVILKADMKNYTDDVKLTENRENASHLKNEIYANEKKLRILKYEAEKEVPLPQPGELAEIRQVYSDYSRVTAGLCDARNRLMSAQDNLNYHKTIFDHVEFDADSVHKEYERINRNRWYRMAFLGATLLLTFAAMLTFVLLFALSTKSLLFCGLVGISIFIAALMCFVSSTMFSKKTELILEKLHIKTKKEFDELHDKVNAHTRTQKAYKEEEEKCKKQCETLSKHSDEILNRLKNLLSYTGKNPQTGAEISHLCDRILTNSESIGELEEQLKHQKLTYQRMLSADVNKSTLTVSSEFAALERELDFVQRQSASLLTKKTAAEEKVRELQAELEQAEKAKSELLTVQQEIEQLSREYNSICALQNPHLKEAAQLKGRLEEKFAANADKLLRNIRKPGERFSLSDRLLPIMTCRGEITVHDSDDSYIARSALLVYKILLSVEYLKKFPLFLYDGFSFVDQKTAVEIVTKLSAENRRLIVMMGPDSHSLKEFLQ